ncbi:penicillin acylase family protein [Aquiflexum gelatinilyticum]|uniref:penicillin acylase family protein n=1 Tax=Aquiflexum gelatinilyticum TaxID=2961943 RepID=UPI002168C425|nr:penicillin acylase family protein [Aquiflexum gelatinilyticum]MCS4433340.1 penicillin acylase family protein [Aquiflexum gelatinilyticum]
MTLKLPDHLFVSGKKLRTMRKLQKQPNILFILLLFIVINQNSFSQQLSIKNLHGEVEVFRDSSGINHIFAKNEHDLFFTQGYMAAKDRLFQFEIWRRQATGTMAEIFGEKELDRDKGVRLFKFRGDKKSELAHYHPRGELIIDSFVEGVNAYIAEALQSPENLPFEFRLLGILPELWTWEVVISRHQGLLENVRDELNFSRIVSLIGAEKTKEIHYFHPNEPILDLDKSIPKELLFKDILAPYNAFRKSLTYYPEYIIPEARNNPEKFMTQLLEYETDIQETLETEKFSIGSNNWVVSGKLTESGYPIMANDPHRLIAVPSLRYMVHLHAPGWDVVGAGEPVIPGVSIGHNQFGAWGLTIFETDNEDMRIYDIHPENPQLYFHKGKWHEMEVITDTIKVKGKSDAVVKHFYTIHGPVTFVDLDLKKAVAVQCAWLEKGGAPYLASLRMDQSTTWEEFRDACTYNHIPAENMIWADREGNIGWQATGITPVRNGFSGLVVTLGDGSKEWDGYLPISERPHDYNPENGFIATANENVTPADYPHKNALGYEWSDSFRGDRVREVLGKGTNFSVEEMGKLQNDYLSLPARTLVPYLKDLVFEKNEAGKLRGMLLDWDYKLEKNSIPAGIYVMWERKIREKIKEISVPKEVMDLVGSIQMTRVISWIEHPDHLFSRNADIERDKFLVNCFELAIQELESKLGKNSNNWQYGQTSYKHAYITHPLSPALSDEWKEKLDAGPVARGGYSFTPGANAYGDKNTSGASFRIVVDTGDWEKTIGINTPGQSGNPNSPFYRNLFPIWAADEVVNIPFGYDRIKKNAMERIYLKPMNP